MTTIDMRVNPLSLDELFQTARMEPLHIIAGWDCLCFGAC